MDKNGFHQLVETEGNSELLLLQPVISAYPNTETNAISYQIRFDAQVKGTNTANMLNTIHNTTTRIEPFIADNMEDIEDFLQALQREDYLVLQDIGNHDMTYVDSQYKGFFNKEQ